MGFEFNFAFLGPEHCYVASVTQVSISGYPVAPSSSACFRLPLWWTAKYKFRTEKQYISNIHGHDFLSYVGRWTSEDSSGNLKASENMINEIEELRKWGQVNERQGKDKAELKLCLGPDPGSFFVDADQCYDWSKNLPDDLGKALKVEMSKRRGYGKISGVAINAEGGWIMHFNEDDIVRRSIKRLTRDKPRPQFQWGGKLPLEIINPLLEGRKRGAKISHIFLNHQHSSEFVLLFNDGFAHIYLHLDFKKSIKELVKLWVEKGLGKTLVWDFHDQCQCSVEQQKKHDAAYYRRRARFHLARRNSDMALSYLREAIAQDGGNKDILNDLRLALVASRLWKRDPVLESIIEHAEREQIDPATFLTPDSSDIGLFRSQYLQLVRREDFNQLEVLLIQLTTTAGVNRTSQPNEWSYSLACSNEEIRPTEIAPTELRIAPIADLPELPDNQVFTSRSNTAQQTTSRGNVSELNNADAGSPNRAESEDKQHYWVYK